MKLLNYAKNLEEEEEEEPAIMWEINWFGERY